MLLCCLIAPQQLRSASAFLKPLNQWTFFFLFSFSCLIGIKWVIICFHLSLFRNCYLHLFTIISCFLNCSLLYRGLLPWRVLCHRFACLCAVGEGTHRLRGRGSGLPLCPQRCGLPLGHSVLVSNVGFSTLSCLHWGCVRAVETSRQSPQGPGEAWLVHRFPGDCPVMLGAALWDPHGYALCWRDT